VFSLYLVSVTHFCVLSVEVFPFFSLCDAFLCIIGRSVSPVFSHRGVFRLFSFRGAVLFHLKQTTCFVPFYCFFESPIICKATRYGIFSILLLIVHFKFLYKLIIIFINLNHDNHYFVRFVM